MRLDSWRYQYLAISVLACMITGCSATSQSNKSSGTVSSKSVEPQAEPAKVNLDEIFPVGRGRELLLNNCTGCHTFVPIVVLQLTKDAWERNSRIHRDRVPGLSDADFRTLYDYIEANFNPEKPVPKLPKSLLETWTSY